MDGFDAATRVERVGTEHGLAVFDADLQPAWRIEQKLNGGYLLAVLARAAGEVAGADHPHPVTATATYIAPPDVGPARVLVQELRRGRTAAQLRTRLVQDGAPRAEALLTFGRLDGEVWWDDVVPPALAPEDRCVLIPATSPERSVPLLDVVHERLDPARLGWAAGRPSGHGEQRGWLRLADGRDPDPLALLLLVDALPPASFDLGLGGWVPTLSLTVHVRAVPTPGPVRARLRARLVAGDRVDELCDLWDDAGRLVATGHQLAGLRVPAGAQPPPRA